MPSNRLTKVNIDKSQLLELKTLAEQNNVSTTKMLEIIIKRQLNNE